MLPIGPGLAVACLQIFIFSENWALAKNINFYSPHHFQTASNVLPVKMPEIIITVTDGPKINGVHKSLMSSSWSFCLDTQYCLTVHHFTSHGRSISITKKCASKNECHFVGCHHHRDGGQTECRSCCEGMICNVEVPTNHTNAVFAIIQARRSSGTIPWTFSLPVLAWVFMVQWLLCHCSQEN
ncbi:ly6/PLAUR domain-containing protein 6B isoform X1 [Notamacropus eugenii]|uniref:ly6/PLAUR domain-containing protein 6B isoform X1 n=1 Tax=Notamacropus eugenii TaxID=9315 RepID=UPI003B678F85